MKRTRCAALLVFTLALPQSLFGADRDQAAQTAALFASILPSTPGAAVEVIRNGQIVFQHGYGVTDLRTLHKIDEHTNFRLASLTKQFTAMAIMLLVHDRKLRYDESLTEVFLNSQHTGKASPSAKS
jgi:CubicO group peptidase (beta-lactamase class C family)